MSLSRILVVDDEPSYRTSVSRCLTNHGYRVTASDSAEKALELLSNGTYDLLISDLKLQGISGLELIKKIEELAPNTATIIMTAYASIETAVDATKAGAFHYLVKPFNIEELVQLSKKAIEHKKLKDENFYLKKQVNKVTNNSEFVTQSKSMRSVQELLQQISDVDSNIIITGEPGTGKNHIARLIHNRSRRNKKLLVSLDSLQFLGGAESIEAELFGYTKGAFPGAVSSREGKIELANGGALLLDNVAFLNSSVQEKLLQIVKEKTYSPLGSEKILEADVRIITLNRGDLELAVAKGSFKKDLYNYLNIISVNLPPLRERKEDIPLLINQHLKTQLVKHGKKTFNISDVVMEHMIKYSWPGNITELYDLIDRVLRNGKDTLELSELPVAYKEKEEILIQERKSDCEPELILPANGVDLNSILRNIEDSLIGQALKKTNGNKNRAAKLLKLNRTTLVEKLRKRGGIKPKSND